MGEKLIHSVVILIIVVIAIGILTAPFVILPKWNVYRKELSGKAKLKEAEWSRRIAVEEAKARNDSATLEAEARIKQETAKAEAEVVRARGVAEANKIIANSLQGNESYLRYLWIDKLGDNPNVIYVPTEAGLPMLEAGKR